MKKLLGIFVIIGISLIIVQPALSEDGTTTPPPPTTVEPMTVPEPDTSAVDDTTTDTEVSGSRFYSRELLEQTLLAGLPEEDPDEVPEGDSEADIDPGTDTGDTDVGDDDIAGDDPPAGMRPSHLLLVALATCSSIDVVEILAKKRMPLSWMEIHVKGEQDPEPPWPYRKIRLTFRLSGEGLTEKAVEQAIRLSHERYCSVAATVRGVADIATEFEIVPLVLRND